MDKYECGMTSDRDNRSARRKHRRVPFCPLQILYNLRCDIDMLNGILHFISYFYVFLHSSCNESLDEAPLANLALTVFIGNRELFAAFTKSNHLNPSKPPSQTKFLLQGRFSVKLMYRK
jgi:hypothetical protein